MGTVSNSFPVKEAIKIEQIKLIEMIIIKRNNENNSPFEKVFYSLLNFDYLNLLLNYLEL